MAAREYTCAACGCVRVDNSNRGRPRKYCATCRPASYVPSEDSRRRARLYQRGRQRHRRRRSTINRRLRGVLIAGFCAYCKQATCGTVLQMRGRAYCSKECNRAALGIRERRCAGCDRQFTPRSSLYVTFCSRQCSNRSRIKIERDPWRGSRSCKVWFNDCAECGKVFTARQSGRKFCTAECRTISNGKRKCAHVAGAGFTCKQCGKQVVKWYGLKKRAFCGRKCARAYERRHYRTGTHRSRALRYGCRVSTVNKLRVFEADGWRCRHCKCSTPNRLRGSCDDNAPELDHIIPLCRGGAHDYANCQTLCRLCNIMKGAMTMAEFVAWNQGHGDTPFNLDSF